MLHKDGKICGEDRVCLATIKGNKRPAPCYTTEAASIRLKGSVVPVNDSPMPADWWQELRQQRSSRQLLPETWR